MPGELWREQVQIGKETTPGNPVAATRIMYLSNVAFTKTRQPRPHAFATGTRDNVRSYTMGPNIAGGAFKFPLSADELIEWLEMGIAGGITPTTPAGT